MAMKKEDVVRSDPDFLSGMPRFVGTRVPLKALFDYIEGGETLDEFLEDFPGVTREQALAALKLAHQALAAGAHPSR
jgi:uncharacterized protein (DUF433 family)